MTTAVSLLKEGECKCDEVDGEEQRALDVVAELRGAMSRTTSKEPKESLRREADYFERNQDAVAYKTYREKGWSTASSEVESGHRSVVQVRIKLPGTWWHPDTVDHPRQRWRARALEFRSIQPRTKLGMAA